MKKTNEQIDLWHYEKELYEQGYKYIGGTDEAGRGPLIGPVVAACCVLPRNFILEGLTDSKKLSEKKRIFSLYQRTFPCIWNWNCIPRTD